MTITKTPISELLSALNPEQLQASTVMDKRVRAIAGPGTGKTKVIQSRIANLIETHKVEPNRILAISFTNESAKEFADRIQAVCGDVGFLVKTGTFHATENRFLKRFSSLDFFKDTLGYQNGFFVIDDEDAKRLLDDAKKQLPGELGSVLKEIGLDTRTFFSELSIHRARCLNSTSYAKRLSTQLEPVVRERWSELQEAMRKLSQKDAAKYVSNAVSHYPQLRELILVTLWNEYSKQCKRASGMDFDDLLLNFYYMLKSVPSVAKKIANEFDHLLVDEYQDTCPIQAYTIKALCEANPNLNLFLVGDTRQSIYSFRAADVHLLTQAEKMFGDFVTVELTKNYRSHPNLIEFNNIFAPGMAEQITNGVLESGRPNDFHVSEIPLIEGHRFDNDKSETKWILDKVSELLQNGTTADEIYVLYRNRNAVRDIEKELKQTTIRYQMIGERNFYECLEVRDAVAFFRTLVRPRDVLAWARICNAASFGVRGVYLREKHLETGSNPIDIIKGRINKNNQATITSFLDFHLESSKELQKTDVEWREKFRKENHPALSLADIDYHIDADVRAKNEYLDWRGSQLLSRLGDIMETYVEYVYSSYKVIDERACKNDDTKNPQEITDGRINNIVSVFSEFMARLESSEDLSSIVDDVLTRDTPQRTERTDSIKLMTGHASKGLESKHVFLVGCDSGIWGDRMKMSEETKAEEDRIYYVMATRAENNMYLTMSDFRVINGEPVSCTPYEPIVDHLEKGQQKGLVKLTNHSQRASFHNTSGRNAYNNRSNNEQSETGNKNATVNSVLERMSRNVTQSEISEETSMESVNIGDISPKDTDFECNGLYNSQMQ